MKGRLMSLLKEAREFLRANAAPHLRGLFHEAMEVQIDFLNEKHFRSPSHGNMPPSDDFVGPSVNDTEYLSIDNAKQIGLSGWSFAEDASDEQPGASIFGVVDVDGKEGHVKGHDEQTIDDLIAQCSTIEEAEVHRSKGGGGLHIRLYFDSESPPPARTRSDHKANVADAIKWIHKKYEIDLAALADVFGGIAWIWSHNPRPKSFELIKQATKSIPANFRNDLNAPSLETLDVVTARSPEWEPAATDKVELNKHQQALVDHLVKVGRGDWDDEAMRLRTHTHALVEAMKALGIDCDFSTVATGKGGPSDRNCFCHPRAEGTWAVFRFGKGTKETDSWQTSPNGFTMSIFGESILNLEEPPTEVASTSDSGVADKSGNEKKGLDPTQRLVAIGLGAELFRDADGNHYSTIKIRGVSETVMVGDRFHKAWLRIAFTGRKGPIAKKEWVTNAIEQLHAVAEMQGREYAVVLRHTEHEGKVYIDLADHKRQVVEVSPGAWRIVENQDCPVRFRRPFGMLPLPEPIKGGEIKELYPFVNVETDDMPLLLAYIIGCFSPGPYPVLSLKGEQGSAKTSLARLIHDFVDPNVAVCCNMPKTSRDLLVAAQQKRLLSFDNLSVLEDKVSDLLCSLSTGAAEANRKLYSDADIAILRAKRPLILTSIEPVVVRQDLLDRTIAITLPPIAPENKKSEFEIAQDLRQEGVRGRIFGAILDGVAAALAGHSAVKIEDAPRMLDCFKWATAAESALGLDPGACMEAYRRQVDEDTEASISEDPFAQQIIALCQEGFNDTATKLAKKLCISINELKGKLYRIAPALRKRGYIVKRERTNRKRSIILGESDRKKAEREAASRVAA